MFHSYEPPNSCIFCKCGTGTGGGGGEGCCWEEAIRMRKEEALRKANMFGNADQATNSGGKFAD